MSINTTKLIPIVCFLFVGLTLIYMGTTQSNEPLEYNFEDNKITFIDLTHKNEKINIISLLGIASILFASFLTVNNYLVSTKERPVSLTPQEKKIISSIKKGMSNKEIASELAISVSTVKTHNNNIYKKLGIDSRDELLKSQ